MTHFIFKVQLLFSKLNIIVCGKVEVMSQPEGGDRQKQKCSFKWSKQKQNKKTVKVERRVTFTSTFVHFQQSHTGHMCYVCLLFLQRGEKNEVLHILNVANKSHSLWSGNLNCSCCLILHNCALIVLRMDLCSWKRHLMSEDCSLVPSSETYLELLHLCKTLHDSSSTEVRSELEQARKELGTQIYSRIQKKDQGNFECFRSI